jgi:hypothetical protein
MDKFFVPASNPEDWKWLLAKPEKHWRTGYSAKSLAYCWQEANDFPEDVKRVFRDSGIELFQNIELLLAFPEWKVPLLGGSRPSQNDIFILARGNDQLISITVEGKVSESFDKTVAEWKLKNSEEGTEIRLKFLCKELQLDENKTNHIRYQLLHRTASALIEAKRFNAQNALMLVHSFSQKKEEDNEGFKDYSRFLALFDVEGKGDSLAKAKKKIHGIDLYFCWIRGDKKYLSKWWTGDLS